MSIARLLSAQGLSLSFAVGRRRTCPGTRADLGIGIPGSNPSRPLHHLPWGQPHTGDSGGRWAGPSAAQHTPHLLEALLSEAEETGQLHSQRAASLEADPS